MTDGIYPGALLTCASFGASSAQLGEASGFGISYLDFKEQDGLNAVSGAANAQENKVTIKKVIE